MADYVNNDPFGATDPFASQQYANTDPFCGDDPFGGQQSVTPGYGSFKTSGTNKLLVVVFVVDCSRSMDGGRINAVNAALMELKSTLQEIKNDNGLELKIAIMSFTSSAKWELQLTDIDEVSLKNLNTRPGLTAYGNAFHELNKVLRKEHFMKHTGKKAPPAIMFLTDGGPTDDFEADLNDLLKNPWFANGSRSAVLIGDAINDDKARDAVKRFVADPDNDIVGAEDSTVIIQRIKIATMHTVAGDPMDMGTAKGGNDAPIPSNSADDPQDPFPADPQDPFPADPQDPFPTDPQDPFPADPQDPFPADPQDPFPTDPQDPFPKDPQDPFPTDPQDPFPTDDPLGSPWFIDDGYGPNADPGGGGDVDYPGF